MLVARRFIVASLLLRVLLAAGQPQNSPQRSKASSEPTQFQLYVSGVVLEPASNPANSTKLQLMVYARNLGAASTAHKWSLSLKTALKTGDKQVQAVQLPASTPYWGRELPPLDQSLEKTALSEGDGRVGYLYFLFEGIPQAAFGGNTKDTPNADLVLSMQDQAGHVWQTKVNLRTLASRAKAFDKAS